MKKIEINILTIIIIEAIFLLYFVKLNLLSILLGILLGIILIKYTKNIKPNYITKTILQILLIPFYLLTIYKIANFIQYNFLNNYSIIMLTILIFILSIIITKKSYHTFIKSTEILFYIILIIKIISFILCLPLINFNNFIFQFNIDYHFVYISLSVVLIHRYILYLTNYNINGKNILVSFINPIYIKTFLILILGNNLTNIYQYPYVNYLKRIKYFDFIERIDGILSFEYLFCFIILLSFVLLSIKQIKKPN